MSKRIIYPLDNGGVCIVIPAPQYLEEHTIEEIAEKDVPKGVHYTIINTSDISEDKTFRDAWEYSNGKINTNFVKAQKITKERLRIERIPLLQAQDVAFQRALEDGSDTSKIVAEKKRLRDITDLADTAKTLDELKAITVL
jgi:hypothetical protein